MNKEFDSDEFLILLLKRMEGAASPSDISYIEYCLATEPLAREVETDATEVFSDATVRKNFLLRDEEQNLQKIYASLRKKRHRKNLLYSGTGTSLLTVMVILFYFLRPGHIPTSNIKDGPVLELSDGKTISLDNASPRKTTNDSAILLQSHAQLTINLPNKYDGGSGYNALKVPKGFIYTVTLSDGTVVHLNADSQLKFPFRFQKHQREVYMDGEAFFEVSKDASRPFIVHAPKADVHVLGTEFNLNTYKGLFALALMSGSVTVMHDDKQTTLKSGYQASLHQGQQTLSVEHFDGNNLIKWTNGRYIFNDTPLEQILDVVNRWYKYPVVYDEPEMAKATYTGVIRKDDPISFFLKNIEGSGHAAIYLTGDSIIHVKRNPRFKPLTDPSYK